MSAEIVDIRQARLMRLARQILGEAGLPSFAFAEPAQEDTAPSEVNPDKAALGIPGIVLTADGDLINVGHDGS